MGFCYKWLVFDWSTTANTIFVVFYRLLDFLSVRSAPIVVRCIPASVARTFFSCYMNSAAVTRRSPSAPKRSELIVKHTIRGSTDPDHFRRIRLGRRRGTSCNCGVRQSLITFSGGQTVCFVSECSVMKSLGTSGKYRIEGDHMVHTTPGWCIYEIHGTCQGKVT